MADKEADKPAVKEEKKGPIVKAKVQKLIKKRWFNIIAPKHLNELVVGEVYTGDVKTAVGRIFHVNLAAVTGETQHQQMHISFKIVNANGDQLHSIVQGFKIIPSAIKRLIRKKRPRVELSFVGETSDGVKVRVKPFGVARGNVSGGAMSAVRNEVKRMLLETMKSLTFEDLVNDTLNNKIQKTISDSTKKIYPLARFEIRWLERE